VASPAARTDGLITETIDDEVVVFDLDDDFVSRLNRPASLVWRYCDGRHSIAELVAILVEELGDTADEDVVLIGLDILASRGLIVSGYEERDAAAHLLSHERLSSRVGIDTAKALAPMVFSAWLRP
jgi:hypothetical protein